MMNVYEASRKLLEGRSCPGEIPFPKEWTDYIRSREDVYETLMPGYVTSTGRFGTSMSARRILGLEEVPRVGLFAH